MSPVRNKPSKKTADLRITNRTSNGMNKKIITLCSSANFYKHVNEVADELEKRGFKTIVPLDCRSMKKTGNYDVSVVKTWYKDPADFHKKAFFIRDHFREIEKADVILMVNDEKHGLKGYIGPNGLMEMALAYYLKKPIYILNEVTKDNSVYEEVMGVGAQLLNGDLNKLK